MLALFESRALNDLVLRKVKFSSSYCKHSLSNCNQG